MTNLVLYSEARREHTRKCMSCKNHRFWDIGVLSVMFRAPHWDCGGVLLEHMGDVPLIPPSPQTGTCLENET